VAKVAIRGAELIDPEARAPAAGTLLLEDGRIAGRLEAGEAPGPDWRIADRSGLRVAPGFIDLHFHGALVSATPAGFADALARDAARMLAEGATAFLATSVCWPREAVADAVDALGRAADDLPGSSKRAGAACLGLHLEGPWISAEAPGAMAPAAIRPFDLRADGEVLARAGERLRMVTLAPEAPGADRLLEALARRDVVAALGHTRATAEQIEAAVARGLRHVTHLWNAMGPVHHREPGVAGTALADDRLSCDLICDGHHVHPAIVRTTARALGDRLMLITDRVALEAGGAGTALGEASAGPDGAPWRRADGTLVGSQLGLDGAVRNARRFAGLGPCEAVAACTLRPARLLGIEAERGTLRAGARADLALLDAEGRVVETWLAGEPVLHRPAGAAPGADARAH
jgi:N-acetylglucosamine-6-phosphate deacetylase